MGVRRLEDIAAAFPFPILGIDSDNGSEFINYHLLRWCEQQKITFTRSRSGNKNDGAHVEQKNWAGRAPDRRLPPLRHRRRTGAAQQDLGAAVAADELLRAAAEADSEGPDGAKVTKKYDRPATPYQRVLADTGTVSRDVKTRLRRENKPLNPAAIQRRIQALSAELLTLTTAKQGTKPQPAIRAKPNDSTKQPQAGILT